MPARDDSALARLAPLFATAAFWTGAIGARSVEDNHRHDEGIARLRALREAAQAGEDVTAHPEFGRWLAY